MPWIRRTLRASGGPLALKGSTDRLRTVPWLALPACLALHLGSLAAAAPSDDETATISAGAGTAIASDPAADQSRGNDKIAANLPDDDETSREARRNDEGRDSSEPRDSGRPHRPGSGPPREGGFRGGRGSGGSSGGPIPDDMRRSEPPRGPRPEWGGRRGGDRPPFAGGRGGNRDFGPGWQRGPGPRGPREFAGRDERGDRAPRGGFGRAAHRPDDFEFRRYGGPPGRRPDFGFPGSPRGSGDTREVIRLLQELRDEVARLNREIQRLRGERRAGDFRGPPGRPGSRDYSRGERREGPGRDRPGRDGSSAERRGPDAPRSDRRGPGGPPRDGRERERGRPEGDRPGGSDGRRGPDDRGPEGRSQRTGLDDHPSREEGQVAEQPRGTEARPVDSAATDLRRTEPAQLADASNVPAQEESLR